MPSTSESAECWLCGGPAGEAPWPLARAISSTFTNHTLAAAPRSGSVCEPCAYLASGDAWREYCAAHPEMGLKSVSPLSWRSYSHVVAMGIHACPVRSGWQRWLFEPPPPPFVYVIAESGQKHLLFRAEAAHERDLYPVQVEEDRIWVQPGPLRECVDAVELGLRMGFTREEIASGRYSQGRLAKAGLAEWRRWEDRMASWRQLQPGYVRIGVHVARGRERQAEQEGS